MFIFHFKFFSVDFFGVKNSNSKIRLYSIYQDHYKHKMFLSCGDDISRLTNIPQLCMGFFLYSEKL